MRYALLALILTGVGVLGWALGRWAADQPITDPTVRREPQIERTANTPPPPRQPDYDGVVNPPPQIIERERITERDSSDDDDDDAPAPRVTIITTRPSPAPSRTPAPSPTTREPLIPDVIDELPDTPDLDLPLLP